MTWTRKDFEAVAQVVLDTYPLEPDQDPQTMPDAGNVRRWSAFLQWAETREALADLCNTQGGLNVNGNRRFDRERFMARTDAPGRDRVTRSLMEGKVEA